MSALDLSSDVGLVALFALTANLLLGLLLGMKYNPWKHWPHRRFNYFAVHNWTGYVALALAILHPILLLASSEAKFGVLAIVYPVVAPKQPWINVLGAAALYVLILVVVTSYYRRRMKRHTWKLIHYCAYAAAILFFIHGIWSDPTLKDAPIDYLDGEKVGVEICALLVLAVSVIRVRMALRHRRAPAGAQRTRRVAA